MLTDLFIFRKKHHYKIPVKEAALNQQRKRSLVEARNCGNRMKARLLTIHHPSFLRSLFLLHFYFFHPPLFQFAASRQCTSASLVFFSVLRDLAFDQIYQRPFLSLSHFSCPLFFASTTDTPCYLFFLFYFIFSSCFLFYLPISYWSCIFNSCTPFRQRY